MGAESPGRDPLPPAPGEIDAVSARALRDAAARARFDLRIVRAIGAIGFAGWKANARAAAAGLEPPEAAALARCLVIGDEVSAPDLEPALGGPAVARAMEGAGLLARGPGGGWLCPLTVHPGEELVFSDAIGDPVSLDVSDDYILPVGSATHMVDALTVREPCKRAVDLGCGQGYLAIRSLSHARRCIATDINPRAIAFARANAAINGVADRVECRVGSLFEPLADQAGQVDLFTCNPPFIIQPEGRLTATASIEGDSMFEEIVRRVPTLLREGGWATVLGIWEHTTAGDWVSRVRGWLEGSRCDTLMLHFESYRPEAYLRSWFPAAQAGAAEPGWRTLCERRGIQGITFGGVVMRRRGGANWLRALATQIDRRTGPASAQLRSFFRTQTQVAAMKAPAEVLRRRLTVAPGWRYDPATGTGGPRPGAAPGLAMALPQADRYGAILNAFAKPATGRQAMAQLNRSGMAPPPDHPEAVNVLVGLATNGCLDIVD